MTYDIWRKIHLYTGFILLTFVVMYFVTGYAMIHGNWFPKSDPVKTENTVAIEKADIDADPAAYALELQDRYNLRGKVQPPNRWNDGHWRFAFNHPGTWQTALVNPAGDSVTTSITKQNVQTTMIEFHRMHGYFGGWLYLFWAFLYDVASLSMLVFAVTGIYMWYKLAQGWERTLGWGLVAASFGFTVWVVMFLVHSA